MIKRYAALTLCVLFWGFNYIPVKYAIQTLSPYAVASLPAFVAACILWIVNGKNTLRQMNRKTIPMLICIGVFGSFGVNFFMNTGLKYTSAVNASFLLATAPVFGYLVDTLFFKDSANPIRLFGALLSICGVVYLVSDGSLANLLSLRLNVGDILVFGSIASFLAYASFVKKARAHCSPLTITTISLTVGSILFIPFYLNAEFVTSLPRIDFSVWKALAYICIVTSICTNLLYTYSLKRVRIAVATMFSGSIPVVVSVSAVIVLNEAFTIIHFLSATLILSGILLAIFGDTISLFLSSRRNRLSNSFERC